MLITCQILGSSYATDECSGIPFGKRCSAATALFENCSLGFVTRSQSGILNALREVCRTFQGGPLAAADREQSSEQQ